MKAEDINYFENNYENLIYTTKSTDWSHNFEPKFQKGEKHRFFSLYYRMKINLRQKIQKLCSNQFVRPRYLDKNLKCLFAHHENPFLKLGPFKYELLNKEPSVGFVHDLISDKQAEKLKDDARPTMKTTPYSTVEAFSSYSRWRTSKVRYFNERLNGNAKTISRNIELVTSCTLAKNKHDSENFKVRYDNFLFFNLTDSSVYVQF